MFSVDRVFAYVVKIMAKQCAMNRSLGNSTKSRTRTLVRREFATATTAEQIFVDGNGNHAGGRWRQGDDPETRGGRAGHTHGLRSLKKFPKSHPWVYISRPCRCDQVEQLGGTEMQNRKRLLQLGVTEKFKSVAPRLKT